MAGVTGLISGATALVTALWDTPGLTTTLTWGLFKGHDAELETFSVLALKGEHLLGQVEMDSGTQAQKAVHTYFIRESDLPSGLTKAAMTKNDRPTDGSIPLTIESLDKSVSGFLYVEALGDQ